MLGATGGEPRFYRRSSERWLKKVDDIESLKEVITFSNTHSAAEAARGGFTTWAVSVSDWHSRLLQVVHYACSGLHPMSIALPPAPWSVNGP